MKKSIYPSVPIRSRIAAMATGIVLVGASMAQAQVWETPYASGSAADLQLRFSNGAGGNATSPNIPFALGLAFNDTTPGLGSGGGWGLSATGTAAVGAGVVIVGETHARSNVGSGALSFQITTSGISNIIGLSMNNKWNAFSGPISGSESWSAPTDNYRYTFDLGLSNDLISLSPAIFSGISLTISGGSNIIYSGALTTILPTLVPSATGVSVDFTYDQADGPLQISWNADGIVNTSLLSILGNGTNTIFSVSNGGLQVEAIPEPGTYALLLGGVGLLALYRRRSRALG